MKNLTNTTPEMRYKTNNQINFRFFETIQHIIDQYDYWSVIMLDSFLMCVGYVYSWL